MDREKQDELPKLQMGWIDGICLPLYKVKLYIILYFTNVLARCNYDIRHTCLLKLEVIKRKQKKTVPKSNRHIK
jgi:hypothetical protein